MDDDLGTPAAVAVIYDAGARGQQALTGERHPTRSAAPLLGPGHARRARAWTREDPAWPSTGTADAKSTSAVDALVAGLLDAQETTRQPGGRAIGVAAVNATAGAIWKKVTKESLDTLKAELLNGKPTADAVKAAFAAAWLDVTLDAAAKKKILDGVYADVLPEFVDPYKVDELEARAEAEFEQLIERELFAKVAGPNFKPVENALGEMTINLLDIALEPLTTNASMLPGRRERFATGKGWSIASRAAPA